MNRKTLLLIFLAVLLFYLPIIKDTNIILHRQNDLEEQFWPVFLFIKQQILTNHQLPLWNNLWFSGMPLLPDPQFSLFYPFNIFFLIFPIGLAFITNFFIHTLLGAVAVFLTCRRIFNYSERTSLLTSWLFIFSPKLSGILEAGHPGLLESFGLFPWVILSTFMISKSPTIKWIAIFSISLAGIFFTHTIIFLISIVTSLVIFLVSLNKHKILKTSYFSLGFILTFGLTAISLLPQLEWSQFTTRFLLLSTREVYPQWNSIKEFIFVVFIPWKDGLTASLSIDSEKWLAIGVVTYFLALFGFIYLKRKLQLIILVSIFLLTLILLNNISPIYSLLIQQDSFVLMRVTTRLWIIVMFIVIFLAGFGLEKLSKYNKSFFLVSILALIEISLLSWYRLEKPHPTIQYVTPEVISFIKSDDIFRVYCTTRCISQKVAAENNLQLVDGYNTVSQINYYRQAWQLLGGYWNYYTLSIPPIGTYLFEESQPDPVSLGQYNTKYVISPYKLTNPAFILEKKFGNYFIYRNDLYLPRAYFWTNEQKPSNEAPISEYTPNQISVDTSSQTTQRLVLSEVYSPGWNAYLNGKEKVAVQEKPDGLRLVDIKPNTQSVTFKYEPKTFKVGQYITLSTILLISLLIYSRRRFNSFFLKRSS